MKIRRSIRRGPTFVVVMKFKKKTLKTVLGKLVVAGVSLKHAKALNEIINEQSVNDFVLLPKNVSLKSTIEYVKKMLSSKDAILIVAELNGQAVGSVELRLKPGRMRHVAGFGISFSKKVHGKGVAPLVLSEVFKFAKKRGIEIISGTCASYNPRALAFYKKMGFKQVGLLKDHLKHKGRYFDQVLIVKKL